MAAEQKTALAVITAQQFNPTIFDHHWVGRIVGLAEDYFHPERSFYSPQVASCQARQFNLLVLPDRLQFEPQVEQTGEDAELIRRVVGSVVSALPHTPYTALGLNFAWALRSPGRLNPEISRRLFFNDHN